MLEILFLIGFAIHNLEEGLWLPRWSHHAGRFHRRVEADEFRFALFVVTILGVLITFIHLLVSIYPVVGMEEISYIYHGFVAMMMLNVVFPHLAATIVLRRYAPGLLTGLLLHLPLGSLLLWRRFNMGLEWFPLLTATAIVTAVTLALISLSFRVGRRMIRGLDLIAESEED